MSPDQRFDNFCTLIQVGTIKSFAMRRLFLFVALLAAAPAHAARYDFGQGAAAVACVMLESGYSDRQVYKVLDRLDSQIRNSATPYREEAQMVEGFNYQARNNHYNCPLRISF